MLNTISLSLGLRIASERCGVICQEKATMPQKQQIPIIDISPFLHAGKEQQQAAVAKAWDEAFCTVGFARIVGHGVPTDLIQQFRQLAHNFFAQNHDVKMRYHRGKYGDPAGGYYAAGHETVSRSRDAMGSDGGGSGPSTAGTSVTATSRGDEEGQEEQVEANVASSSLLSPPASVTPVVDLVESFLLRPEQLENDPRPLADVAVTYRQEMLRVLQGLHELSATALGLNRNFFDAFYATTPQHALRLGYYPAVEEPPPPSRVVMRYGEHTDYTGFTILLQDDGDRGGGDDDTSGHGGGLEVKLLDGTFLPVRAVPDSFVVNIGDMFQVWTNDRWKSTVHRVSAPRRACGPRLSIPFFTGPNHDALIAPIGLLPDETPRHETITAGEHYWKKLKATQT
jgi:isopenicillin N synthase-like dioxygenase